ncbi:MAG: CBS domain-containing protein [Treponema sp.]|jgi:putative hemolysin|nr:CBS domain-containing protein [Treponema sp.]
MEDPLPPPLLFASFAVWSIFSLIEAAFVHSRKTWLRFKFREKRAFFLPVIKIELFVITILTGILLGWWERCVITTLGIKAAAGILVSFILLMLMTDRLLRRLAAKFPEQIIAGVYPLVKFTSLTGKLFFKSLLLPASITEDELHDALVEGERSGIVERKERAMVEGVFYLGDRPVNTFMTHRSEVAWMDISYGPDMVLDIVNKHREQRYFPVIHEELDAVVGVVSVEDVLFALVSQNWGGLKAIMHKPFFVPETLPSIKAFEAFKKNNVDFLVVMDEYSGFAGILSIRALIEEIVGELSLSAKEEQELVQQKDGTWLIDGSLNIDDMVKALKIGSIEGEHREYHTAAGLILELSGEIPQTGRTFEYAGYTFTVIQMDGNRIEKLKACKTAASKLH